MGTLPWISCHSTPWTLIYCSGQFCRTVKRRRRIYRQCKQYISFHFEDIPFGSEFEHHRTGTGPHLERNLRFGSEFTQLAWTEPSVAFVVLPKHSKNRTEPNFDSTMWQATPRMVLWIQQIYRARHEGQEQGANGLRTTLEGSYLQDHMYRSNLIGQDPLIQSPSV